MGLCYHEITKQLWCLKASYGSLIIPYRLLYKVDRTNYWIRAEQWLINKIISLSFDQLSLACYFCPALLPTNRRPSHCHRKHPGWSSRSHIFCATGVCYRSKSRQVEYGRERWCPSPLVTWAWTSARQRKQRGYCGRTPPTHTHTHTHTNIYTQETERLLWQDPRRLALKFNHEADNTLISEYVREAFFMSLLPSNLVPFLHLQLLVTCRWQMLYPGRCARLVSVVWHCRLCKHGNRDYSHL